MKQAAWLRHGFDGNVTQWLLLLLLLLLQELSHVADSLIGDESLGIKGISGGEKR
jgi:hypothetical protein